MPAAVQNAPARPLFSRNDLVRPDPSPCNRTAAADDGRHGGHRHGHHLRGGCRVRRLTGRQHQHPYHPGFLRPVHRGAVVVSQYLGREDVDNAKSASKQLLYAMTALSVLLMAAALIFRQHILSLIFGRVEPAVMDSALIYFLLTAAAYPFMGVYNAGAALFRAWATARCPCSAPLSSMSSTSWSTPSLFTALVWELPGRYRQPWSPASPRQ